MVIIFENDYLDALRVALDTVDDNLIYEKALNGIHFDFKNRRMLASDGHRAFICELPTADITTESITIVVKHPVTGAQVRKIPNSWKKVVLDFDNMLLHGTKGQFNLIKVDSDYPVNGLNSIMKDAVKSGYISNIGTGVVFNLDLIAGWKVGAIPSIGFSMIEKSNKMIVVTFPNLTIDHIGIIMPMNFSPIDFRERIGGLVV